MSDPRKVCNCRKCMASLSDSESNKKCQNCLMMDYGLKVDTRKCGKVSTTKIEKWEDDGE